MRTNPRPFFSHFVDFFSRNVEIILLLVGSRIYDLFSKTDLSYTLIEVLTSIHQSESHIF